MIKTWKNFTDEQALLHGKPEGQTEDMLSKPVIVAVSSIVCVYACVCTGYRQHVIALCYSVSTIRIYSLSTIGCMNVITY